MKGNAPLTAETGTCRRCGCTEINACLGGCWWADRSETLCNLCARLDELDFDLVPSRPRLIVTRPSEADQFIRELVGDLERELGVVAEFGIGPELTQEGRGWA